MRSDPLKHPRRVGQHVSVIMDDLTAGGATDIEVTKTKHLRVQFILGGQQYAFTMCCTPTDQDAEIDRTRAYLRRMFGAVLRERAA